ncbi:hypothetical protein M3Y94_01022300 [Aphelenchoides besseyi]|nr:hypothetical protein M3Y94_01022300 [Aphelenchoides besseyi]KAI6216344.1 hypothetical protein M3Y95_01282700 [Aphelenchoides besseyi]
MMANPKLNPRARSLLLQHFERNVGTSSVRRFGAHFGKHESTLSTHVLRLINVSSRFCITAHCHLKASTLIINPFSARQPNHWTFEALNNRSYAQETAQAIVSLVKPRFGHLKVSKVDGQRIQIDEQFIRNYFIGIPKLTIYGNAVEPLFRRMLVLMAVALEALECNCNYLKPSVHMPPLNLKMFKSIEDFEVPPSNFDILLAHRIEKIQSSLKGCCFVKKEWYGVELSKNCAVQPALEVLVLEDGGSYFSLLPQWFYERVPNLKKQFFFGRVDADSFFADEVLSCVETLAGHGEQVLQTNASIEQLIYDVVIVFSGPPKTIEEGELAALQQTQFFTSGICSVLSANQLKDDADAKGCPCMYEANDTVLVLVKRKMKFFIYVFSSYIFSSDDESDSDYDEVDSQS